MVDNNLGPKRLAGPNHGRQLLLLKEEDCRQLTLVQDLYPEVLTVHDTKCTCFGPWHSPYSYYQCRASDISTFNVYSYDAEQMCYVLWLGRELNTFSK